MLDEKSLSYRAEQFQRIFFYRICGTGMGQAACLLKENGLHVEGCDLNFSPPMGPYLKSMNIKCYTHQEVTEELLRSFDLIVVGNVIPRESEEAKMIEQLGVPFCSFPAVLGAYILRKVNVVGVAGTHGKTTTTYFMVQLFESLGERPGYFIGGVLDGRPSSRIGDGSYFFIESDEYDSAYFHKVSKFHSYHLNSMILTSLELDHADIFSSIDDIKDQFYPVIENVHKTFICSDEYEAVGDLMRGKGVIWYGGEFPLIIKETTNETHFQLQWNNENLFFQTNIVGKHNIKNLSAAILYALDEGFSYEKTKDAIRSLQQVKGRQELRGYYRGCPVIDDFAHHPRAVQLTIDAIRVCYPHKKINVIFGPASSTARSKVFQREFSESFKGADQVLVLMSSHPTTVKNFGNIDWKQLQKDLSKKGLRKVAIASELKTVLQFIEENSCEESLFLVLSNGPCLGLWESELMEELKNE